MTMSRNSKHWLHLAQCRSYWSPTKDRTHYIYETGFLNITKYYWKQSFVGQPNRRCGDRTYLSEQARINLMSDQSIHLGSLADWEKVRVRERSQRSGKRTADINICQLYPLLRLNKRLAWGNSLNLCLWHISTPNEEK